MIAGVEAGLKGVRVGLGGMENESRSTPGRTERCRDGKVLG